MLNSIFIMPTISTNEFRNGTKILLDGQPCVIIDNECVKPGKGQAFNRVKIRHLLTGRVLEKTFKSGESVEAADVLEQEMQYLYAEQEIFYFMDQSTYEQIEVPASILKETQQWLKEQELCTVTLFNGQPILVTPANFVSLEVVETDPGLKGDTSSGGSKPATLSSGAVVKVPLFVQIGERIKVDTRDGTYVSRD